MSNRYRIVHCSLIQITAYGVLVAALFIGSGTSGASSSKHGWNYYLSRTVGKTCTIAFAPEHAKNGSNVVTTTGNQTKTLLSVSSSSEGTTYRIRGTVSIRTTDSDSNVKPTVGPIMATQILKYMVLPDGTLETPLQKQISFESQFTFRGHLDIPSVPQLETGATDLASMHFTFAPSTSAGRAEVEVMTNGANQLSGVVTFRVSGAHLSSLSTPRGTFRDLIGVQDQLINMKVTGAVPAAASAFDSAVLDSAGRTQLIAWYAPGHGVVGTWSTSSDGKRTIEYTTCK